VQIARKERIQVSQLYRSVRSSQHFKTNGMKTIKIVVLLLVLAGCSATRIPKSLDNLQVQGYLETGKARLSSEYIAIIAMGTDSIIYQTYWVDKSTWILLTKK
jgi:hypothetical protein